MRPNQIYGRSLKFHFSSVATTWALFALTQNRDSQDKLRAELTSVSTDNPTMDELNSLPYLDAVVRETLRVHAPVPTTMRVAKRDDVVPLSEPYTDKKGRKHHTITCV
jgi:cytochrome P450